MRHGSALLPHVAERPRVAILILFLLRFSPTMVPIEFHLPGKTLDVVEFFSGQGEYTRSNRRQGRCCCELDINKGKHCDLDGASGFASETRRRLLLKLM